MSWFSSSSSDPPSSSWILLPSDSLCFLINSLSASASDSLFSTHSKAPSHVWGFGQTKYVLYIIIISHGQACWERVLFYHLPRLGPSFFTVLCTLRFPQAHLRQKSVQYHTKQPTKVAAPYGLPRTTQRMRCKLECKVLGKWRILVHCWVLPWTLSSSPANLNWQHQNNWTIWFTRFHLGFPTATVRRQWFISPLELTLRSSCSSVNPFRPDPGLYEEVPGIDCPLALGNRRTPFPNLVQACSPGYCWHKINAILSKGRGQKTKSQQSLPREVHPPPPQTFLWLGCLTPSPTHHFHSFGNPTLAHWVLLNMVIKTSPNEAVALSVTKEVPILIVSYTIHICFCRRSLHQSKCLLIDLNQCVTWRVPWRPRGWFITPLEMFLKVPTTSPQIVPWIITWHWLWDGFGHAKNFLPRFGPDLPTWMLFIILV